MSKFYFEKNSCTFVYVKTNFRYIKKVEPFGINIYKI